MSIEYKLLHAQLHMKTLFDELERYFKGNPGAMVREKDEPANAYSFTFQAKYPVPARIPLLLGDVLQNLRSTLDYLVWELAIAAKNVPTKKNQFPICFKPKSFEDAVCKSGRLDGVDVHAIHIIEGLQPYHLLPVGLEHSFTAVLDELVNINKHRTIITTVLATTAIENFQVVSTPEGLYAYGTPIADTTPRRMVIPLGEQPNAQIGAFMQIDEGYVKGAEISSALNALFRTTTENILPLFEEFFA